VNTARDGIATIVRLTREMELSLCLNQADQVLERARALARAAAQLRRLVEKFYNAAAKINPHGCTDEKRERVYPDGGNEGACGQLSPAGPADLRAAGSRCGADRAGGRGGVSEPVREVSPPARDGAGAQDGGRAAGAARPADGV
jgi:hypothetical protein